MIFARVGRNLFAPVTSLISLFLSVSFSFLLLPVLFHLFSLMTTFDFIPLFPAPALSSVIPFLHLSNLELSLTFPLISHYLHFNQSALISFPDDFICLCGIHLDIYFPIFFLID